MNDDKIIEVMVVEDEQVLRDVYRTVLSLQGYRVTLAKNGIEALQQLREVIPDVILLDVLMPEMGGLEFMRNYDASKYPTTQIIINSNVSDLDIISELIAMGAHSHVLKSDLTPNTLIDIIQKSVAP